MDRPPIIKTFNTDIHFVPKGLFHKAIQSSGSALNPWAIENPEVLKGRSAAAIHMVGCSKTKSADLLSCLQAVSAESLVNTTHTFQESVCCYLHT